MNPSSTTSDVALPNWIGEFLQHPDHSVALVTVGGNPCSYSQLRRLLHSLVAQLRAVGVVGDDRIAVMLSAGPEYAITSLAAMSTAGCIPINPDYPAQELKQRLVATAAQWLVCDSALSEMAHQVADALDIGQLIVSHGDQGWHDLRIEVQRIGSRPPSGSYRSTSGHGEVLYLQTSGSTAEPKIVPLSINNLRHSVHRVSQSLQLGASDRCINMLPMYHVGGLIDLLLAPLSCGGSVIISQDMSVTSLVRALRELQPTWFQAVPTMLQNIVRECPPEVATAAGLRLIRSVSSPLPSRVLQKVEHLFNAPVIEMYGMTETAGIICSNPLPPAPRKQGSVGRAFGVQLRIVDPRSRVQSTNRTGEVQVRGDSVFAGYESEPKREQREFDGDWLRTGDEGYLDEDGYLYLVGRLKEIINRGGEKIAPMEIDRAALGYPGVIQAAAFALPHPSLGEDIAMALVVDSPEHFEQQAFLDFLGNQLARFKLPRTIALLERIPTTRGGKLQRHRLPELLHQQQQAGQPSSKLKAESHLEKQLATLWCELLERSQVYVDDDFFEAGGDSLNAAVMMAEIKSRLGVVVPMSSLYRAPTIRQLAELILTSSHAPTTIQTDILHQVVDELGAFMAAWRGDRVRQDGLLVGRNINGTQPALFWGVNAYPEFDHLAQALGDDQPIYGFRSLFKTNFRYRVNPAQLARVYLDEIREIQPAGPYLLGGFCEAGKVAFELATLLQAEGESIASLMLQDQFIARPYTSRVACFVCAPGENSPLHRFHDPLRGWRKYYGGQLALYRTRIKHHHVYQPPQVGLLARQIEPEIRRSRTPTDDSRNQSNAMQLLPSSAYQAALACQPPARAVPLSRLKLCVAITNTSHTTWLQTERSGVMLGSRWSNRRGVVKTWKAGFAALENSLQPGATTSVDIEVQVPWRLGLYNLELDMVDDGVSWFNAKGNAPLKHPVRISLMP